MKFKPGDPVWIRCDRPELGQGELPGVVTECREGCTYPYHVEIPGFPPGGEHTCWSAVEEWLRPRKPPGEKKEPLGKWENCPWRPERVVA